jgi:hypothetical protein
LGWGRKPHWADGRADVKMTKHYQAGHEGKEVEYQRVGADLKL